jgi:hypothetical protein
MANTYFLALDVNNQPSFKKLTIMRSFIFLILIFLCLNFSLQAQPELLETRVSLQYKEARLERVIKDIHKNYRVNFSYVNNLIPLDKKVSISITNQPLRTALDEIFKDSEVDYQVVGNQIVLKQSTKKTSQIERIELLHKPAYLPAITDAIGANIQKVERSPDEITYQDTSGIKPVQSQPLEGTITENMMAELFKAKDKMEGLLASANVSDITSKIYPPSRKVSERKLAKQEKQQAQQTDASIEKKDSITAPTSEYIKRPVQFTFVSPLGTNGIESGAVVNQVSFNLLMGYAAGLEGVEFGGLLNIEKDYVKGVQFAGLGNLVKNQVTGSQFAGFFNVNGGTTKGAQFAGFLNTAGPGSDAIQFAGFTNVLQGKVKGGQFAGFANIAKGDVHGMQAAGFVNVATGSVKTGQIAGFLNVAKEDISGPQIAGFANLSAAEVAGAQVSGFINVARKVRGAQVGIINIADSIQGVQIGLINLAKNGYRRVEIWGSEALYANIAYKMGTRGFHTIFALGAQGDLDYFRYGYGFGVGSEIGLGKRFAANIDALAYHINEDEIWTSKLNELYQLRTTLGVRLGRHSYFFAGPAFNVMVSQFQSSDNQNIGSGLAPTWTNYNENHGHWERTNVKMWPGIHAGFRF